jgi:hypothetical protein
MRNAEDQVPRLIVGCRIENSVDTTYFDCGLFQNTLGEDEDTTAEGAQIGVTAHYQTGWIDLGAPERMVQLHALSVLCRRLNATLDIGVDAGAGFNTASVSMLTGEAWRTVGMIGRQIRLRFGVTASDVLWEVLGYVFDATPLGRS